MGSGDGLTSTMVLITYRGAGSFCQLLLLLFTGLITRVSGLRYAGTRWGGVVIEVEVSCGLVTVGVMSSVIRARKIVQTLPVRIARPWQQHLSSRKQTGWLPSGLRTFGILLA